MLVSTLARGGRQMGRCAQQVRQYQSNIISGPPRTRVSFVEKAATGLFMSFTICIIPCYVLANMKEYTKGH